MLLEILGCPAKWVRLELLDRLVTQARLGCLVLLALLVTSVLLETLEQVDRLASLAWLEGQVPLAFRVLPDPQVPLVLKELLDHPVVWDLRVKRDLRDNRVSLEQLVSLVLLDKSVSKDHWVLWDLLDSLDLLECRELSDSLE